MFISLNSILYIEINTKTIYFDEKKAVLPQQSSHNAGRKGLAWDVMLDLATEFIWSGGRISGEIKRDSASSSNS